MNVFVYYTDVSPMKDPSLNERLVSSVSRERQISIKKLCSPRDRRLSVGAEILLRKVLEKHGLCYDDYQLARSIYGKPYLVGCPMDFNISHSGEHILCAVSEWPVGCDVELIGDFDIHSMQWFIHQDELRFLSKICYGSERTEAFYRLWTMKESLLKASGTGLAVDPGSFNLNLDSYNHIVIFDGIQYAIREFSIEDGYAYSVCSTSDEIVSEMEYLSMCPGFEARLVVK